MALNLYLIIVMILVLGYYHLDFFQYEQYNETVWGTYTCPFELMAPGMWATGEPNNVGPGEEDCAHGGWDYGATYGINDKSCDYTYHSVICEFPSEN